MVALSCGGFTATWAGCVAGALSFRGADIGQKAKNSTAPAAIAPMLLQINDDGTAGGEGRGKGVGDGLGGCWESSSPQTGQAVRSPARNT